MSEKLTHIDARGEARMVNVGDKPSTKRRAVAEAFVRASEVLLARIRADDLDKGSVLQVARVAGIQAAKRTHELIPLCHQIPLDAVELEFEVEAERVAIRATARATYKTGVEMEAMVAVSVAALTIVDMGKAVDRSMVIEGIRLLEKSGGASGDYRAP